MAKIGKGKIVTEIKILGRGNAQDLSIETDRDRWFDEDTGNGLHNDYWSHNNVHTLFQNHLWT